MSSQKTTAGLLFGAVVKNDSEAVRTILDNCDPAVWREVIRYEHSVNVLLEKTLKGNKRVQILPQFEIQAVSSFHFAALMGYKDVLAVFLKREVPVDVPLASGSTALHMAALGGHTDLVKYLIRCEADVTKTDGYKWTALHYAAIVGHMGTCEYLVEEGVKVDARDKDGTTAAYRAFYAGHETIVDLCCKHGDRESLLAEDDDVNSQDGEEPDYYSLPKKLDRAGSEDNCLLPKRRPPPPQPQLLRTESMPPNIGHSPADAGALPRELQTFPRPAGKRTRREKVRKEIRRQLDLAFNSDYMEPVKHGAGGQSAGMPCLEDNDIMCGMGLKTLRGLLREEMEKYQQEAMLTKIFDDIVSCCEDDDDIYETLPVFDAPPISNAASPKTPPALPPRNEGQKRPSDRESIHSYFDTIKLDKEKSNAAILNHVFKKIAPTLSSSWRKLAWELKLGNRIDFISAKYPKDPEKQAMTLLGEWRINNGNKTDIDDLLLALRACKLNDVMSKLESVCQEFTA